MQNHSDILIDTPPPYDMDLNAWPSSYYGRTRRIDLEKFYHDILKASSNDDPCNDSSSSDEDEQVNHISTTCVTPGSIGTAGNKTNKKVTFSAEPPMVFEYEPEYDQDITKKNGVSLFDDGWPGRTKIAMKSTGFIDFKSKIEAKLGAINDPSLISQLDTNVSENCLMFDQEQSPLYRGYYRHRKSPLVQKLNLRPVPNEQQQPSLMMDDTPSPSNSYTDSPLTPRDSCSILEPSVSSASSNTSMLSPGGSKWLNRTLSRIRSNNTPSLRNK